MFVCLFIYSKLSFFKHCVRFFSGSPRKSHNEYKSFFWGKWKKQEKINLQQNENPFFLFKEKKECWKFRWINQNFFVRSLLFFFITSSSLLKFFSFPKNFLIFTFGFFYMLFINLVSNFFFHFFFCFIKTDDCPG